MLLINLCNTPFCWRGVSPGLHHNSFKSNGPSSGRSNFWMSKKHPRNHVGNVHVGVIPWQALMNYCKLQWFTNFLGVCQLELDPKKTHGVHVKTTHHCRQVAVVRVWSKWLQKRCPTLLVSTDLRPEGTGLQLMVNWWLGPVFWVSLSNNPFHKGKLGIQTTGPQTTCWDLWWLKLTAQLKTSRCRWRTTCVVFFWIIELGGGLGFESSHWSNWNRCYSPWNGHDIAPENRKGPTRISRKYSFAIQEFRCELLVAGRVWIIMISIKYIIGPWLNMMKFPNWRVGWIGWMISMEPKNHHLPSTTMIVFHVNFPGCTV